MSKIHKSQSGIFHITIQTYAEIPWCTMDGVPDLLIYHLSALREIYGAQLYAFCILPTHIHCILCPGSKGLRPFMKAFLSRSEKAVYRKLGKAYFCWEEDFFEGCIQNAKQRFTAIAYVHNAVMKHGLVREIMHWPWTSLRHASILDSLAKRDKRTLQCTYE